MLFSHLFLCLSCRLPPLTVPCKMVFARPDEWETWPYHCSFRLFTMVRRSSCGPIARTVRTPMSKLKTYLLGLFLKPKNILSVFVMHCLFFGCSIWTAWALFRACIWVSYWQPYCVIITLSKYTEGKRLKRMLSLIRQCKTMWTLLAVDLCQATNK